MRKREFKTLDSSRADRYEEEKSQSKLKMISRDQHLCRWMPTMKKAAVLLCVVYISVPVVLYLFPWTLGYAVYSHLLRIPLFTDLSNPAQLALNHTCNFYLTPEEGISVGVWHTVPDSQWQEAQGRSVEWYSETLGDGHPVIIYLHGNVGTRALSHRVKLVKVLSAAGYHVLSLDYRGYGDSTGEPSEAGMTSDALYLYKWVKARSSRSLVCLWGHSLGTGVATNAALKAQAQGSGVDAVILEAPYTDIGEEAASHPFFKMYLFVPGFESLLWNIIEMNNIVFANNRNLKVLTSPVLLLHAEDDHMVPFHMGQELYQIALQAQRDRNVEGQVQMVSYSASLGYSHNYIYLDPNLSTVITSFLEGRGQ